MTLCAYCNDTVHTAPGCPDRKRVMYERYVDGETYDSIGRDFGVTRERVRQIVAAVAGPGVRAADQARAARREARERELTALRSRVMDYLRVNPGASRHEVADHLGCRPDEVSIVLGPDAGRLLVRDPATMDRVYTRSQVLEGLRRAAAWLGTPTMSSGDYDRAYRALGGMPSGVRILQLFDTWNAALTEAGLPVNAPRRQYSRRWSEAEMLQCVVDYLADDGSTGSIEDYGNWAREHGAPSGQTVRNTFGSWTAVKSAALPLLHARRHRGA
ncbi:sigma factor-like helix-turn-helix DNA-binding protein [Geodermatophilus sp. SYSU D00525]